MVSAGANLKALNAAGGTPENIRNLVNPNLSIIKPSVVKVVCKDDVIRGIQELAEANLLKQEVGLTVYREHSYYQPDTLKTLWKKNPANDNEYQEQELLEALYKKFVRNQPKLIIKQCEELSDQPERTLGLYADSPIPLGKIITLYSGAVIDNKKTPQFFKEYFLPGYEETYTLCNTDAAEYGNTGRCANWGWPNALVKSFYSDGAYHHALICADPKGIAEGEEILWDYGPFCISLAYGKKKILGREKMREFFSPGLTNVLNRLKRRDKNIRSIDQLLEFSIDSQRLCFPLNTIDGVLDLHFSGIVKAKEWGEAIVMSVEDCPDLYAWNKEAANNMSQFRSVLNRITEVDAATDGDQKIKQHLSDWVLGSIGTLSVMQILKGFDRVKQTVKEKNKDKDFDWNSYFVSLTNELESYDWLEDDDAPLCEDRIRQDELEHMRRLSLFNLVLNLELGMRFAKRDNRLESGDEAITRFLWLREKLYQEKGFHNGEVPAILMQQVEHAMQTIDF